MKAKSNISNETRYETSNETSKEISKETSKETSKEIKTHNEIKTSNNTITSNNTKTNNKVISNNISTAKMAELGLCEVDITPTKPVRTIGFGREDELSRGVLHSLSAQISLWQFGTNKCCLVTIDHIGFDTKNANYLRSDIANMLSISMDKVMLCFSHTHSAPDDSLEIEYFNFICSQVKEGVQKALKKMGPVKLAWGNTYADIGVNRRADRDDFDKRIGILKVIDADSGNLKLLLLRLTAHANVLKEDNYLISPDYFGEVRDLLSEKYGCTVMVTQGAAGNISPKYYSSSRVWTAKNPAPDFYGKCASDTALSQMAEEVFLQVDKVINTINPVCVEYMEMYSVYQKLDADVPSYERAIEIMDEAKREAGIDGTEWVAEVQMLLKNGITKQTENVELQYFALNNGCLCGVPNEIMCEFALRANEQLQSDMFYFGGYTNGCTGYFPTEEEYDEGGYEVYWSMLIYYVYHGRVSPLNQNSATTLIETAVKNAPAYIRKM